MPRLVLQFAPAKLASTASRMRLPGEATVTCDEGSRGFGGILEVLRLHAMAGGEDVHIARLQSSELIPAGGEKCGLDASGCERKRHFELRRL